MGRAGYKAQISGIFFTHRGEFKLLCIVDIVHADFSIGQEVVALNLPCEQQVPKQLVISTSQHLVEDVVAPLSRLLLDHTRLLQQVCMERYEY